MDLLIMIFSWALAIVAIIIAIAKRETNRPITILLVVSSFLSIGTGTITYFKATKTDERAKKAEKTAEKINKATNLSIVLSSYNPETQKMWIEEENELKEELKRSKAEEVDKVLATKAWCLAREYLLKGETKSSLEFIDYSLLFVETGLVHGFKGLALYRTDTTNAMSEYCTALKMNPNLATVNNNFGLALNDRERFPEAELHFREAIRLKPNYAIAHNNLGTTLHKQGKTEEAIAEYRAAIRLDPNFAEAHYNLGIILMELGKNDEAIAEYGEAIRLT